MSSTFKVSLLPDGAAPATGGVGARLRHAPSAAARWVIVFVLPPAAVLAVVLIVWQTGLLARWLGVGTFVLPPPSQIVQAAHAQQTYLIAYLRYTVGSCLLGYCGGNLIGYIVAVGLVQLAPRTARGFVSTLSALIAVPSIVTISILALFFSAGQVYEAVVASIQCAAIMGVYAYRGLTSVSPDAVDLMRSYDANRWQMLRYLRQPSSILSVFVALRFTVIIVVVTVVIAEVLHSRGGLGVGIAEYVGQLRMPETYAVAALTVGFTLVWFLVVSFIERGVRKWLYPTNT